MKVKNIIFLSLLLLWGVELSAQIKPRINKDPNEQVEEVMEDSPRNRRKPRNNREFMPPPQSRSARMMQQRPSGKNKGSAKLIQKISGLVVDDATGLPLSGVEIIVRDSVNEYKATSNEEGIFKLTNMAIGWKNLSAAKDGYEPRFVSDFLVKGGGQRPLELTLEQVIARADSGEFIMDSVVIVGQSYRQLAGLSLRSITIEETRRYAATFFDPARLATSFPGVTTTDDATNHISVRGNSPNALTWRLEGVEIVNPNHLSNAGTFSDKPTLKGGGVNILSAQMIKNTTFSSGAYDARYGNSLGGLFDMNLQTGNPEKDRYVLQPSLIGMDIAAEGPVGTKGKNSFIGNMRYSTVGILDALGVDVGDEKINYYDGAFKFSFPDGKLGNIHIFGMAGKSVNKFKGDSVHQTTNFKSRFDIDFKNSMNAYGLTHNLMIAKKALWKTTVALSSVETSRTADYLDTLDNRKNIFHTRLQDDVYNEKRLSIRTALSMSLGKKGALEVGGYYTKFDFDISARERFLSDTTEFSVLALAKGKTNLMQAYARFRMPIGTRLSIVLGAHLMKLSLNERAAVIEPRLRVRYRIHPKHSITLGYGMHSQMQPLSLYFSGPKTDTATFFNQGLGFTRAHHAVLSYGFRLTPSLSFKLEPYAQYFFEVPAHAEAKTNFSALNLFETPYVNDSLETSGTALTYGVEFSAEQTLSKGYYYLLSATYYKSTYTGTDGIERDARFSGEYAGALTIGKEFHRRKRGKHGTWGIHLKYSYQGGYRTTPIDTLGSIAAGRTLFQEDKAWSIKNPDYTRLDLRISHTRHKANYTRTFSIDIQNVLNNQNTAFQFYDPQLGKFQTKYQLGTLPLLTYRVEF